MPDTRKKPSANPKEGIPLFYLGDDPAFEPLARSFGALHPFYSFSIQPSVIHELKNPYSLRCIAEHFAKAIREKRPCGPYMLGGWCAHGVLALETAQILREQGQEAALLVLLGNSKPRTASQAAAFGPDNGDSAVENEASGL
jgi:thioesterase domain-containing protein